MPCGTIPLIGSGQPLERRKVPARGHYITSNDINRSRSLRPTLSTPVASIPSSAGPGHTGSTRCGSSSTIDSGPKTIEASRAVWGQCVGIAARHRIKPLFVFFDSCWDPFPKLGRQRAPKPGVHNSGWVQSPGAEHLDDLDYRRTLLDYVTGVLSQFRTDDRFLGRESWNEPTFRSTCIARSRGKTSWSVSPTYFRWRSGGHVRSIRVNR